MFDAKQAIETINRVLNMKLQVETTPVDVPFKDLGIDSLDFYNVLVELEALTGRDVPDDDVEKLNSIQSLVAYFS